MILRGFVSSRKRIAKSLKPLSLWANLVQGVGLVPGPNQQGQNWIRNFLREISDEQMNAEMDSLRGIHDQLEMDTPLRVPRRG